jgi:hypothetical protein
MSLAENGTGYIGAMPNSIIRLISRILYSIVSISGLTSVVLIIVMKVKKYIINLVEDKINERLK